MNFLEELIAEWYEYQGYFIRRNVKFGKRERGGYSGEMDVIAFEPNTKEFIHFETSTDADPWPKREQRFQKKFNSAKYEYHTHFPFGMEKMRQVAVVGFSKPKHKPNLGEYVELILVPEFIRTITEELRKKDPMKNAVPEGFPLLRSIQYSSFYVKK